MAKQDPAAMTPFSLWAKAIDALNKSRPDEAEAIFEQLLSSDPQSIFGLVGIARVDHARGNSDRALERLEHAVSIWPDKPLALLELAMQLRNVGRLTESQSTFEKLLSIDPRHEHGLIQYAALMRALGRGDDAAEMLRKCLAYHPQSQFAHCQLVQTFVTLNKPDEAASAAFEGIASCGPLPPLMLEFALALKAGGRPEQAVDAGRGAEGELPVAVGSRPDEAIASLRQVLQSDTAPDRRRAAVLTLTRILRRCSRDSETLSRILAIEPGNREAHLRLAKLDEKAESFDRALERYENLMNNHPGYAPAYVSAAALWSRLGAFEKARDILARAERSCPPSVDIARQSADLFRQMGRIDEAYAAFVDGLRIDSQALGLRIGLAHLCVLHGRDDEALALLRDTDHACATERCQAAMVRAWSAEGCGDLAEAIRQREIAQGYNFRDHLAIHELARLQLITFDLEAARRSMHEFMDSNALVRTDGRVLNVSQSLPGQLYDELRLEPDCLKELVAIAALPPIDRLPRLVALVRAHPDNIGPALALLLALRLSGKLAPPLSGAVLPRRIPALITQYWNDAEVPPDIAEYQRSWVENNPGYSVERFDDERAFGFLARHIGDAAARAFRMAREPARRADIFRLGRLFAVGGYYVDADDRCRAPLDDHLPNDCDLVAYQEPVGSVANNVIGVAPRHPITGAALEQAVASALRGDLDLIWLATGPGLITRTTASWLAADGLEGLEARLPRLAILPIVQMRQVAAMFCHAAYKLTERAWANASSRKAALSCPTG